MNTEIDFIPEIVKTRINTILSNIIYYYENDTDKEDIKNLLNDNMHSLIREIERSKNGKKRV